MKSLGGLAVDILIFLFSRIPCTGVMECTCQSGAYGALSAQHPSGFVVLVTGLGTLVAAGFNIDCTLWRFGHLGQIHLWGGGCTCMLASAILGPA